MYHQCYKNLKPWLIRERRKRNSERIRTEEKKWWQIVLMLTAIVIDDNKDSISLLSEFSQIKDIKVVGTGCDGMDALKIYKKLKPDVVFLDVMMYRYDGFYALEKIR